MGNILPLVAAILVAGLGLQVPSGEPLTIPGVLLVAAAYFAAGRAAAGLLARAALRAPDDDRVLARFHRAAALHRHLALPVQALVLWPGGLSTAAASLPAHAWAAGLLLAFLPWPLLLLLSRAATWPAERALGFEKGSFAEASARRGRLGALVAAPVLLLAALSVGGNLLVDRDLPLFRQAADLAARFEFVEGLLLLAGFALVLAFFPVLAMGILGARPLPPGPLRDRLEAYARRTGLRYRDLYLWDTGGTLPNAAVMGVGRRLRCVVFTDALLDRLRDEEVEAVFAHEAGHAIHHHIPLFFAFTVAWLLGVSAAGSLLPADWSAAVQADPFLSTGLVLLGMGVYFGILFGFVSRRLEQQADVHGLLTIGLPEGEDPAAVVRDPGRHPLLRAAERGEADPRHHPFVASLEGLAASMGGIRELTGWRHFSIADRVGFLGSFARDPSVREAYRRRLRGLLGMLAGLFLLLLGVAAADLPVQLRGPDPAAAFERAVAAIRRREPAEARAWLEAGLRGAEARGLTLSPEPRPLPPGNTAADLSPLEIAALVPTRPPGSLSRFALRACEALLHSALRRHDEAVAAAENAVRESRAWGLPVAEEVLRRAGRPAAADAAARAAREP